MRGYKKIYEISRYGWDTDGLIVMNIIEELGGEVFQIVDNSIFYKLHSEIDHEDFVKAVRDEIYNRSN